MTKDREMKLVYIVLTSMVVAGVLSGIVISGISPTEPECEHLWTAGASQEYAQRLLADGWMPPIYYYTCIACGEEIGSTCELDTSVAGDMLTKAAETPELVIDTDSGADPNFFTIESEPNLIWLTDASISSYADLMISWEGGDITMSFENDKFEIIGDTDKMNGAAKVFFDEMIKPMADAYIAERINN